MMLKRVRNRYYLISDLVLLLLAAYFSYVLRLETFDLIGYWSGFTFFTVLVLLIVPLVFRWTGAYSRYWRYASIEEMLLLIGSITVAVVLVAGAGLGVSRLLTGLPADFVLPRSVPLIFLLLAVPATAGPRFAVRVSARYGRHPQGAVRAVPTLVMGAGDAGAIIVRELQNNPQLGMDVVGFVDDDTSKHGVRIHGTRVLGSRSDIGRLVSKWAIEQVIIAMPKASGKAIREIVSICEQAGVKTKIMPGIYELLDGTVSVNQLRDVQIEDLLRREPIQTDIAAVGDLIRGKRVLVTGGGGSIGSELCRQIIRLQPASLVIIGHGENSVFDVHNEMLDILKHHTQAQTPDTNATPVCQVYAVIADIRFEDRLRVVFDDHKPDIVFHAAAHKHVPMMELNPCEAITNNVLGTRNLINIVQETGVKHFVMISTDKAVNPTSVMGASKRVAELLVHQAAKASGRAYVAVRFGNVLGSRGSVVPLFTQQIATGGPVTITHPDMRRYFMTIPEAVQLVLQAAVLGRGGEVFVLDMGQPVKMVDLAHDLITLSGLEVGRDIDIVFSGIRPGEKLFEELFVNGEAYQRTQHEKIVIASNASSFVPPDLDKMIDTLENEARENDAAGIRRTLQELVPEYHPASMNET